MPKQSLKNTLVTGFIICVFGFKKISTSLISPTRNHRIRVLFMSLYTGEISTKDSITVISCYWK